MKCYLVANITITDPARYRSYRELVPAVIAQYGGQYLVRAGAVHPLEGDFDLDRFVIIEFPSMDAATRFYRSPEYAPLLELRSETTHSHVAFIEGYAPA